jgi:hypothetical protein
MEIKNIIENAHYPNHCMYPSVMEMGEQDIGEWDDSHPLNSRLTKNAEYWRLFPRDKNGKSDRT